MGHPGLPLYVVICLGAVLLGVQTWAADPETPTKYILELSTETTALPFTLEIPDIPGMPKIPKLEEMFKPQRLVTGRAVYPHEPVPPIFVTVPKDLGLPGNKLELQVPRSLPGEGTPGGEAPPEGKKPEKQELEVRLYWHPDVAEGPAVEEFTLDPATMPEVPEGDLPAPPALYKEMLAEMGRTASGTANVEKERAVGQGDYTLNTGKLTIPLAGFLPVLNVTSPAKLAEANLPEGVELKWNPVPGARGFIVHAMSMTREGNKSTIIRWVSTLQKPPERVQDDYEQATTIADDLANGILLPPETVSCKVPAGIFPEKPGMFMLDVMAIGNDFYDQARGVTLVGKIRAKWSGMTMGEMPEMPDMPDMPEEEEGGEG